MLEIFGASGIKILEVSWSSRVGPRLKVEVLIEGNAWTSKSRIFVGESSEELRKLKVSGLGNVHRIF